MFPPGIHDVRKYGQMADDKTTIRVKFSDGTQIQSVFASTSAIQPVYAFVRTALKSEYADKSFNLCTSIPTLCLELD